MGVRHIGTVQLMIIEDEESNTLGMQAKFDVDDQPQDDEHRNEKDLLLIATSQFLEQIAGRPLQAVLDGRTKMSRAFIPGQSKLILPGQ